jgi:uncharacterized LabA/DUF88 family protein
VRQAKDTILRDVLLCKNRKYILKIFKKVVKKERVIVYIDGFNLYFVMTSKYNKIKWLDVVSLAKDLLKPNQQLVEVRYYTAMIANNPPKVKRQVTYIDAVKDSGAVVIKGQYKVKPKFCRKCKHTWNTHEEKMTDVNISVGLLVHAMNDRYDTALLISGDTDLVPPMNAVHTYFPNKRVVVAFPPNRINKDVRKASKGSFVIGRKKLVDNQFNDEVTLSNGTAIKIPNDWK